MKNHLVSEKHLQTYNAQFFLQDMTNNVRFKFNVFDIIHVIYDYFLARYIELVTINTISSVVAYGHVHLANCKITPFTFTTYSHHVVD